MFLDFYKTTLTKELKYSLSLKTSQMVSINFLVRMSKQKPKEVKE